MKSLFIAYLIVTVAISFTFDVWTGTAFALAPLGAEVGGVVMRVAAERGDYAIGLLFGSVLGAVSWIFLEWMDLTVAVFSVKFDAGWWALLGLAVGFIAPPPEFAGA